MLIKMPPLLSLWRKRATWLPKYGGASLTQHFQVSLSQEVLRSWMVNDAVHWNSIIIFGDRKSHPAGHGKHPVVRLLDCRLA